MKRFINPLIVFALVLCAASAGARAQQRLTIDELLKIKRVGDPQLSPDGRWVAYASNESGRYEVYVRPFPGGGEPAQVSNAGGAAPRWRRDGRELFYLTLPPDQSVVAVPVGVEGGAFKAGAPAPLFKVELSGNDYDVSADGQRFLINTTAGVPPTPLTVKTGWAAALKR